jgi:hypothetical protein
MATLTAKPCANCSTPSTTAHPLKRCGKCKDVNYCNKICQRTDWKAHKSVCEKTPSSIAILKEVLVEDGGQFKLGQKVSLPYSSFVHREMPPTRELPFGFWDVLIFPPGWLASIAHLSKEEQDEAKAEFATKQFEAEEAQMTPEGREAERLQAEVFGEIQQKVTARVAAGNATKNLPKSFVAK